MASSLTKDAAQQGNPVDGGKTFFGHPADWPLSS